MNDDDDEPNYPIRFTIESLSVQVLRNAGKTQCPRPTRICPAATLLMCGTPSAVLYLKPLGEEFPLERFLEDLNALVEKHRLSIYEGPAR